MASYLRLLGGASLEADSGPVTGPAAHRHRLALLALLATGPTRGRSREVLLALLWPERDALHARKLLNQSVYVLRRELGEEAIISAGEELRLAAGRVPCDVMEFEEALGAGEWRRAVELYGGPFLDGFHLDAALEFERWTESERTRLADARAAALEELADAAESRGDYRETTRWWKLRAAQDPYDARVALCLVETLGRAGNLAGAIREAEEFGLRLRGELGIEPPDEIRVLVDRLRAEPTAPERTDRGEGDTRTASGTPHPPAAAGSPVGGTDHVKPPQWDGVRRATVLVGSGLVLFLVLLTALRVAESGPGSLAATAGPAGDLDSLARAVAREIGRRGALGPDAAPRRDHRSSSLAAIELYERATAPVLYRSPDGPRRGVALLRRAISLDSTYAAAWAGLALMTARRSADTTPGPPRHELLRRAGAAARRAVALDDSLPEAHAALGFVRMAAAFDAAGAAVQLRRAIELDPSDARFREWIVAPYLWAGRWDEALLEAERAVELDPASPSAHAEVARVLVTLGRCEAALERLDRLAGLRPPLLRTGPIEAMCRGDDIAWLRRQAEGTGNEWALGLYGHLLGRGGARKEAFRIRGELLGREGDGAPGAFPVAMVDAGLGDLGTAFEDFGRAVEDGSLLGSGPHFTMLGALRDVAGEDARFAALAGRIGLSLRSDCRGEGR